METKKTRSILFKIVIGILLIGIVVWPFFVCPKDATGLFSEIMLCGFATNVKYAKENYFY